MITRSRVLKMEDILKKPEPIDSVVTPKATKKKKPTVSAKKTASSSAENIETVVKVPAKEMKKKKKPTEIVPKVPKGKPKSGRIWKSEKKKFSSIIKTKGIRSSLEKKQALRQQLKDMKELSKSIKDAKAEEKEAKKMRRRENLKRQEENRKKSEVVQVITNTKKLKKIKKKHLRTIEKRDTTVVS